MNDKIQSYRDLNVWKKGKLIVMEVYKFTQQFPKEETYGLTVQMRRAAVSIVSNVAEGYSRRKNGEYRHFLNYALGSCAELETQIEIASALGMLDENISTGMLEKLNHESRMLRNLSKKLEE
jgi:four helix bundle protein